MTQGEITIDDLLAEAVPKEARVAVLLRQDLLARHEELDAALRQAIADDNRLERVDDALAPALARQLEEFEAEIAAAKREFVFRSVGRRKWADLLAKHPPTKEQVKLNGRLDHNPETFPSAAIAASCIAPELTAEQVDLLGDRLTVGQFGLLWQACLEANVGGGSDVPKSVLAGGINRANDASERLRSERSESLAASSSVE